MNLTEFLQNVSLHFQEELSFPNWSPVLFMRDLYMYPPTSESNLYIQFRDSLVNNTHYLSFFLDTRGYKRPSYGSDFHTRTWIAFHQGSVMMYLEPVFLKFIDLETPGADDRVLLEYIYILSENPIYKWDEIVEGIGACCYQYFVQHPYLYITLLSRGTVSSASSIPPNLLKDQEMLSLMGNITLGSEKYIDGISIHDNRPELVKMYTNSTR